MCRYAKKNSLFSKARMVEYSCQCDIFARTNKEKSTKISLEPEAHEAFFAHGVEHEAFFVSVSANTV